MCKGLLDQTQELISDQDWLLKFPHFCLCLKEFQIKIYRKLNLETEPSIWRHNKRKDWRHFKPTRPVISYEYSKWTLCFIYFKTFYSLSVQEEEGKHKKFISVSSRPTKTLFLHYYYTFAHVYQNIYLTFKNFLSW